MIIHIYSQNNGSMKSVVITIGEDIEVGTFVSKFNDDNGLTGGAPLTVKDFLDFTGSSNLTNRQKIVKTYTPEEQLKWMSGADPTMIKAGIFVRVPLNKTMVEKQLIYGKNQYLKQDNFNAYFNEYQKILQSSDGYYKLESLISHIDRVSIDAQVVNLNVRVWIYSKVLDELIDVSPLVVACNTSKNMAMGAFSITLNPAKSLEFDVEYPTAVNQKGSVNTFNFTGNRDELIADYFEKYIQYNDLVFIRFERLQVEKDDVGYESGQVLKLSTLANPITDPNENPSWYRVWDMMGLIDSVDVTTNFSYTDKSISIKGRDFMKLLSEDGSYFYSYRFMSASDNRFMWMGDENSGVFKRNILTGQFEQYFLNYSLKSIKEYLGFVVNRLSNLGIISSNVFSSYGERLSKLNKVEGIDDENRNLKGVWSIIKFFFDEHINDRVLSGDLGGADGTLLELFNRICQPPFVEIFGDTWIDMFNFTVRQPPFTGESIRSVINDSANYITIENKDLLNLTLGYDTTSYAWYQVTPSDTSTGEEGKTTAANIPVVFLPQIAEVFGNKRLQISDIYLYTGALKGQEQIGDIDFISQAILNDLLFLIESFVYLPFTRKGTIQINGDRRIKVGTFIRLDATDELYYVTGVDNSLTIGSNIDRVTTIQVERGMRWDLIKGVDTGEVRMARNPRTNTVGLGFERARTTVIDQNKTVPVRYSYFNIVNTEELRKSILENRRTGNAFNSSSMIKSDFNINEDVFEYMLKRRYL